MNNEENHYISQPFQLLLIAGVRQSFSIAKRTPITYEEAIEYTVELAPYLLPEDSEIVKAYESSTVRLYQERAMAKSRSNNSVTALELINADIDDYEQDLKNAPPNRTANMRANLSRLDRARSRLLGEKWSEHKIITRDAEIPDRYSQIIKKEQGYRLYPISKDRLLATRVLHPDKPEDLSGVDLIYETFSTNAEGQPCVRIVVIQYKIWDGENIYTSRAKSLPYQLDKMQLRFCESGLCDQRQSLKEYRLPCCCAFLRLTDFIQTKDGWRLTDGKHLRVCQVKQILETTRQNRDVLRGSVVSENAINQDSFQELYNLGMLGSDWLSLTELESLYHQIGIFSTFDTIMLQSRLVCEK